MIIRKISLSAFWVSVILFLGCRSASTKNESYDFYEASIFNFEIAQQYDNNRAYSELIAGLKDRGSSERAIIWQPKARYVRDKTADLIKMLDSIENKLFNNRSQHDNIETSKIVFSAFKTFRGEVNELDQEFSEIFKEERRNKSIFNSVELKIENFNNSFKDVKKEGYELVFSLLRSEVLNIERRAIAYCLQKISYTVHPFEQYSAVVNQSSNVVQPGEKLKIMTAMGSFTRSNKPIFTINGQKVEVDELSSAEMIVKASEILGKYSVPVTVDYTRENGEPAHFRFDVKYEVKSCDQ